MEIQRKDVLAPDTEVISVREYCEEYGNGLTGQSLYYLMDNDLIDWVSFGGREKYIVMTEKTRAYTPNKNKKRTATDTENAGGE